MTSRPNTGNTDVEKLQCIVLAVDRRSIVKGTKVASGRSPIYKGFY